MANLQTKNDKNALSANWEANLLVKDRISGKLKRLRFQNHDAKLKEILEEEEEKDKDQAFQDSVNVNNDDSRAVKLAPNQTHFMPLKLASEPPEAKAALVFHPEDHAQLAVIAQTLPVDESKKYSIEKIVSTLLVKQGLDLDQANQKRLTNILFDFFRNRKRFLNVRELLTGSIVSKSGSLSEKMVDSILSIAKGIKSRIEAAGGLVVRNSEIAPVTKTVPEAVTVPKVKLDIDHSKVEAFRKALEQDLNKTTKADSPWALPTEEIKDALKDLPIASTSSVPAATSSASDFLGPKQRTSDRPLTVELKPVLKKSEDKNIQIAQSLPSPTSGSKVEATLPAAVMGKLAATIIKPSSAPETSSKKTVTDVWSKADTNIKPMLKARHVLTGPVEELANLSLGNWRRLGESDRERVDKILEKIKVLEHNSFTKKTQGLEAWRRSPVHQLYLQLGLESMQTGQELKKLIEQHQRAGEEILTPEEFMAIADLNQQLRFL